MDAQGNTDAAVKSYEHGATSAGKVAASIREDPGGWDSPALIGEVTVDMLLGHAQALHKAHRCAPSDAIDQSRCSSRQIWYAEAILCNF